MQQPNVHIERNAIVRIVEDGIETEDGKVHQFDAIVCATGFDTSFSARYNIIGRSGLNLRTLWKDGSPEAYLGLAVAGFPNYFGKLQSHIMVNILLLNNFSSTRSKLPDRQWISDSMYRSQVGQSRV